MDYKKAYKEAHSRAEMFRNTIYKGVAEEIFPDLRESSYDEKIRKELIEMVKEDWPGRSDVVDWLEKQGEQNPAKQPHSYELEEEIEEWLGCEAFPEGTNITPLPKAMEIVRETANHFYDFGRKQQAIRNIQCTNSQVITPESYINEGQKKGIQIVLDNPQEYGLQKPAEWSEEDERQYRAAIAICNSLGHTNTADWLKSHRPQSHWKPSEEQMLAMQKALVDLCGKDEHNIITGLYYDLKKLRKE